MPKIDDLESFRKQLRLASSETLVALGQSHHDKLMLAAVHDELARRNCTDRRAA